MSSISRSVSFRPLFSAVLVASVFMCCLAPSAFAGPVFHLHALANSTVAPGAELQYFISDTNVGDEATPAGEEGLAAEPRVLHVTLPAGVKALSAQSIGAYPWDCSQTDFKSEPSTVTCTNPNISDPHEQPTRKSFLTLVTSVAQGASGALTATFEHSGGGAPSVSTVAVTEVSATLPDFGIAAFDGQVAADATGDPSTQAGGHPFSISTSLSLNTLTNPASSKGVLWPVEPVRDTVVDLPPGFVGYPTATGEAKCTPAELANSQQGTVLSLCPTASQVGVATIIAAGGQEGAVLGDPLPVFNMVAPPGVPARFGFNVTGTLVTLDARLRSSGDYGLSVDSRDIPEGVALSGTTVTFWGVPSDPSHDLERACPGHEPPATGGPSCVSEAPPRAFLRNPTSCSASEGATDGLTTALHVDSWTHPGGFATDGSPDLGDPAWKSASFVSHAPPAFPAAPEAWGAHYLPTGCGEEPFEPSLSVAPGSPVQAASPSGFTFDLGLPQSTSPDQIATADIKRLVVQLPEGVVVNPSAAGGLGACTPAQIGLLGTGFPAPNPIRFNTEPVACPDASKLGTVQARTPLLDEPLVGSVYLASQGDNPFGSLLAVYVVLKGPGVIVKLPGRLEGDPVTGRLTATFDDLPQLPVEDLQMSLKEGPRAPLVTPAACGSYTTQSSFSSWAEPDSPVGVDSSFQVGGGPGGAACGAQGFAPGFVAGTLSSQAGGFSPFTLSLSRQDGEQALGGLTVRTPPGLLGVLKSVAQCPEPQAAQGACGADSLIGHVTATAGAGPAPVSVAGQVFLTGPYKGSPFGLSIVVPAAVGPFNLGTVIVRSRIDVDPHTSQLTITSDAFPTILQGIPLQIRGINVTVDRAGFTFNPTNCAPLSVTGTVSGSQGASAGVSSRFQAVNCARLPFHPSFKVSTQAKTSKLAGASLDVNVASGAGQANIGQVAVKLPKQLPSRLKTIQQACLEATFAANPASCPAGSDIGTGTARTPVLANALSGPAYLVSHGGAAFPDLVVVLQGEGITVDLTGSIDIKGQVTSSTFAQVPDVPISTFELKLPEGPHSALTSGLPAKAKGSLCGQTLTMPTTLTGQNGASVKQSTKIAVTGCAKPKKKPKSKRQRKARPNHKKG